MPVRAIVSVFLLCFLAAPTAMAASSCPPPPEIQTAVVEKLTATSPIAVLQFQFTNDVSGRCPVTIASADFSTENGLVLWTNIVGGDEAIDMLRREGRLPLRHKWERFTGVHYVYTEEPNANDEFETAREIPISRSIGRERLYLATEVAQRDFFDWRTWSRKQARSSEVYRVTVIDRLGDPIPCIAALNCTPCANGAKCAMTFVAKRPQ